MLQIEAENQIAAASALWLHKRCELRLLARRTRASRGGEPSEEFRSDNEDQFSGLRHYGIIVFGHHWSIWVTEPTSTQSSQQQGTSTTSYTVTKIWQDTLDCEDGVRNYAVWQNWIHYWGLGPSMEAFKKDVQALTCDEKADADSIVAEGGSLVME
jgi:hypothetical protein